MKVTYQMTPRGTAVPQPGGNIARFAEHKQAIDDIKGEVLDTIAVMRGYDEKKADLAQGDPGLVAVNRQVKKNISYTGTLEVDPDGKPVSLSVDTQSKDLGSDYRDSQVWTNNTHFHFCQSAEVATYTIKQMGGHKRTVIEDCGKGIITLID